MAIGPPQLFETFMADSKLLGFSLDFILFQGVISKIKAAKRYALTKIMPKNNESANNSDSSLTTTDESSRQRSETRTKGSRGSLSFSKTIQLKSSSRSESKSFEEDESTDEEEDEEDYKPGKFY